MNINGITGMDLQTQMLYNLSAKNTEASKIENNHNDQENTYARDDIAAIYSHDHSSALFNSEDGVVIQKAGVTAKLDNRSYQSKLSALGFYSGPIDGNLTSSVCRSAIVLFQKVYGVTGENGSLGSKTKSKLLEASDSYTKASTSQGIADLKSAYGLDNTEKNNLAKTWAFLRVGMGLTAKQSAGVMGNMLLESRFASDNAANSSYPGDHNSNYVYNSDDGIAYGLIQWKNANRKKGLLGKANELGLSVSDLNAQFAYFRQEMTSSVNGNSYYKNNWTKYVKTQSSVQDTCDMFAKYIEGSQGSKEARRSNAQAIYNAFSAF